MSAITFCSDFGAPKIKSDTVSTVFPSISHEVSMRPHTGWGFGKRDRGKDTQTQRQKRKFSGVSLHGDTKPIGWVLHRKSSFNLNGLCWWLRWQRICLQWERPGFYPWVWKITWRRERQATLVFLPEKYHGQRSLEGYKPWRAKKSESFSKQCTLAIRAPTHEFKEHTFSPQYYVTKALLGGTGEKEACWFSGPSVSLWAFFSRLRGNSQ